MENTKKIAYNQTFSSIGNFSEIIASGFNIDTESFRDYLYACICMALAAGCPASEDIEGLYIQDKFRYYEASKNSFCINSVIIKQGSLEQEITCRKVLGILLSAEEDMSLRYKFIKILRKHYPLVYNAVKKQDKRILAKKYIQLDALSRQFEARMDSAVYFYFSLYCSSKTLDQSFIESIAAEYKSFRTDSPLNASISKELELHKTEIDNIKKLAESEHGNICSFKDIFNNRNIEVQDNTNIWLNLFLINKLDMNYIFSGSARYHLNDVILAYLKSDITSDDQGEAIKNHVAGIFMRALLEEYNRVRDLYLKNNNEVLLFQIKKLEEKMKISENENMKLKATAASLLNEKLLFQDKLRDEINKVNRSFKDEISSLQDKVQELENRLQEEKLLKNELNALREYIFEVNNDSAPKASEKTLDDCISGKSLVIIGGSKDWRRKFREKYPQIRTLHGFNENFDTSLLACADFIFFYTGYMNHSTYYKAMNFIRANHIKFSYIGKTNMDLVEEEIIEEMQKPKRK